MKFKLIISHLNYKGNGTLKVQIKIDKDYL